MTSQLPEDVQDSLLQHPRVQSAVRNSISAAEAPLSDPVVQQRVLSVCMERFPELAEKAPGAIVNMGKDENAQQKAKEFAGVPALKTVASGFMGPERNVVHTIEQGHPLIRLAAFLGGTASIVLAILQTICFWDIFIAPLSWLLGIYQILFSGTTIIFEAKPEWIRRLPHLDQYQNMLLNSAGFLAKSSGRGFFYTFQGTLWLGVGFSLPGLGPLDLMYGFITKVLGLFMLLLGLSHLLMHCGIFPQDYAPKLIQGGRRVSTFMQGAMSGIRGRQAEASGAREVQPQPGRRESRVESF
mmetsp:Transcript_104874/g.192234  ORF Transcript_104874/g.192234 Transcript_104874/m.192234 type:complete len:298 (-) Transcript_104874:63-956(-)